MKNEEWLIVDTETNGLYPPIFTLEIAAQRMVGWEPAGEPFRVLLNHDVPIDPGAQAVHGYSREFLRREGIDPREGHARFRDYAGGLPIVAYNLSFDWDRVLLPEYRRLRVPEAGCKGFCAMTLARRVVRETANHRLDTLKQHFRLSEAQSHRGLNDVLTVVALFRRIFRERLEPSGIVGFEEVSRFSRLTPLSRCWNTLEQGAPPSPPALRVSRDAPARPAARPSVGVPALSVPRVKAHIREVLKLCRALEEGQAPEEKALPPLRRKLANGPYPFIYPMCALRSALAQWDAAGDPAARAVWRETVRDALAAYTDSQD